MARNGTELPEWRKAALNHRQKQLLKIPEQWRLDKPVSPTLIEHRSAVSLVEPHLSAEELEITSMSTTLPRLQAWINNKQYTAEQITSAFCHRSALLQQYTGCLTEILFDSALAKARYQDEYQVRTGKLVGPLHGIPISIKDNQDIQGVQSTLGWVGLLDKHAESSVPLVETLLDSGAIVYCKTNIPQSLMMSDSYNHLYGQSVNSLNRNLISGGSSGGEGALVGAGGSVLGIGTDIGGSVRIPAVLQGLYGLSPSTGRVGNRESSRRDKYVVPPVAGPMARDIDSIDTFMSTYLSQQPWHSDPGILPIPWRQEIVDTYSSVGNAGQSRPHKKLRIAYMTDDSIIRPQPPVVAAVQKIISLFASDGHEIIDFALVAQEHHQKAYDLWLRAVLADGGERFNALASLPNSDPLIAGMLVGTSETKLDVNGRMALYDEIYEFQRRYSRIWTEQSIDALVMPVTQWVGLKPKMWVKADMHVGYTSIWNMMNWTALAIPSIKVDKTLHEPDAEWNAHQARSFSDKFNHEWYEKLWSEGELEGMPVGVQIVTGRLEEEKAVGLARYIRQLENQVEAQEKHNNVWDKRKIDVTPFKRFEQVTREVA